MAEYVAKETIYFNEPGPKNTDIVVQAVTGRCKELGIKHVVVASSSGETAVKFAEALKDSGASVVAVTYHSGFKGGDECAVGDEMKKKLDDLGVKLVVGSHALSGVGRSISEKFGGVTPVEIIAHTLRRISQGVKVGVEISVMAADAGLVPTTEDIIAVGGSGRGADAAIVLKPAHMNNFFDIKVREIIAMPR